MQGKKGNSCSLNSGDKIKLVILLLTFLGPSCLNASEPEAKSKPKNKTPQSTCQPAELVSADITKASDTEKSTSWKGEQIIFLADDHYPEEKGELLKQRAGKMATIKEVTASQGFIKGTLIMDESHETLSVNFDSPDYWGFLFEYQLAQNLVGHCLWTKGKLELLSTWVTLQEFNEKRLNTVTIPNTVRIEVTNVDWGYHSSWEQKKMWIKLFVKSEAGVEGYVLEPISFSDRYHLHDNVFRNDNCVPVNRLFQTEDPHVKYPSIRKSIWTLIEKEQVAIGMTKVEAMLACGRSMIEVGAIVSGEDTGIIFKSYSGQRFLIINDKVAKYVD